VRQDSAVGDVGAESRKVERVEFVTELMREAACGRVEVFADRKPALQTQIV
jgi:hypothetical protein